MTLTDSQLDRYSRQIILKEFGGRGQQLLLDAKIVVVGTGGVGAPAIQYLAAAGVGQLLIIDDDRVELSNLQRQVLFGTADISQRKSERALAAVEELNPDVKAEASSERVDSTNGRRLLEGASAIIDGTDNFESRLAVADAAFELRIPLVSASVGEFDGQFGVFVGWRVDKPCYRCFVGDDPQRAGTSCSDLGVLGAVAGVMGSLAALEAIRLVTGFGEDSSGKLLVVDALRLRLRTLTVRKDPGCPTCAA